MTKLEPDLSRLGVMPQLIVETHVAETKKKFQTGEVIPVVITLRNVGTSKIHDITLSETSPGFKTVGYDEVFVRTTGSSICYKEALEPEAVEKSWFELAGFRSGKAKLATRVQFKTTSDEKFTIISPTADVLIKHETYTTRRMLSLLPMEAWVVILGGILFAVYLIIKGFFNI